MSKASVREPKSLTEVAMSYKRDAFVERVCKDPPVLSAVWDREATKLMELPGPPDIGVGGEVVRMHSGPPGHVQEVLKREMKPKRANIRDTLAQGATRVAEEASVWRTDLLSQSNMDAVALGVDAADSIGANNSLEKMLAHQLGATHEISLRLLNRALGYAGYEGDTKGMRPGDAVEACRLANSAARLMSAFQDGLLTIHRIRTGGNQTMTVQHVNVESGAQAVIGNVRTGGLRRRGSNGK